MLWSWEVPSFEKKTCYEGLKCVDEPSHRPHLAEQCSDLVLVSYCHGALQWRVLWNGDEGQEGIGE